MKSSHPPVLRMIKIDQFIRDKKFPNCSSIAREFEVTVKTIHRDIEYMRDQLRAPIEFNRSKNGYYYTEPDYYLPAIHLNEREILSFLVNERILTQYKNTPYYKEIKAAIRKIMYFLPPEIATEVKSDFISFRQAPESPIEQHKFELIQQAILDNERLKMKYYTQSRDQMSERLIDPYLIHHQHGSWYLVAHCHNRNANRIFALNRIRTLEHTDDYFDKPADLNIEQVLQNSFGIICGGETYHVTLKFSPYQARWIRERQWHKTQQLTELDDGGLILEMDVQGLDDVKRWVMQYGGEVEVVGPGVLKKDVLKEVERMRGIYK